MVPEKSLNWYRKNIIPELIFSPKFWNLDYLGEASKNKYWGTLIFLNKNSDNGLINGNGLIMYLDEHDNDDEYVVPL